MEHEAMSVRRPVSVRIFKVPGVERLFERPIDAFTIDGLTPTLPLVLETLGLLHQQLVAPIKCTLELVSVTAEGDFLRGQARGLRDWVIQAPAPAHLPRSRSDWPLITEVVEVTPLALDVWMRRALAEPGPHGTHTWFEGVYSAATRVRLPDLDADEVELEGTGMRVPIQRRADGTRWVAGATGATDEPPVLLRVRIAGESITLSLGFCWSLWSDRGTAGRALVDEVAARVCALGWDDLGFAGSVDPPRGA
jgi:hypothetical protein